MNICSEANTCATNLKALIRGQTTEALSSEIPLFMERVEAIQKINEALDIFIHGEIVSLAWSNYDPTQKANRYRDIIKFGETLSYHAARCLPPYLLPYAIVIIGDFCYPVDKNHLPDYNSSFAALFDHVPGGRRFEIIYGADIGKNYWKFNIDRRFDIATSYQYRLPAADIYGRERHALMRLKIATLNAFGFSYDGTGFDKSCTLYFHKEEDEILARITYPNGLLLGE